MGVVAGGMADGTVSIWDPSRALELAHMGESVGAHPLLFSRNLHSGQSVSCLEFNPGKPSLLGTGGADGQIHVLNIENPCNPEVYNSVTTSKHTGSEVTCISWNRKVTHILATASNQGLTVVWDLKNKKEVISFKDPAGRVRCSALSWNPDIPTQLMVAYNDDTSPCLQLWDMRNCSYPFKEFAEHSRGITSASFCDLDSNLLITSGRDNRTICWSIHSGQMEPFSDIGLSAPAVKVDWSHHLPGFVVASSASGTVSVNTISQRQTDIAVKFPPKWLRMPSGVSFGFGGKVVCFSEAQGSSVAIHLVPEDPSIISEADRFESYLASDLRPFCAAKVNEAFDEHEKLTWTIIDALFDHRESKMAVMAVFGIDATYIKHMADKYVGKDTAVQLPQAGASGIPAVVPNSENTFSDSAKLGEEELDNLFDQLARNSETHQVQLSHSANASLRGSPKAFEYGGDDSIHEHTDWTQGPESIIRQNMIVGNIAGAVECCMKCGRYADAFFLAAGGDAELVRFTRTEYAKRQSDPFIKLIDHLFSGDLSKLVARSDLNDWTETLAIIASYATDSEFQKLVHALGERLEKERFDIRSAVLCYLVSGSFEQTVRIWSSMSGVQASSSEALQHLVEKMSCLFSAVQPKSIDSVFSHKMLQYAGLLANSGRIVTAMRCLAIIPDNPESLILKDRIFNAAPAAMAQVVRSRPAQPFEIADIRPLSHQPQGMTGQQVPTANRYPSQSGFSPSPMAGQPPRQPAYTSPHATMQTNVHAPYPSGVSHAPPQPAVSHVSPMPQMNPARTGFSPVSIPAPVTHAPPRIMPGPQGFGANAGGVPQGPPMGSINPHGQSGFPATQMHAPPPMTITPPVNTQVPPANPRPVAVTQKPSGIPARPATQSSGVPAQSGAPVTPAVRPQESQGQYAAPVPSGPPQSYVGQSPAGLRPVTGPPTSAGVSTAPHATANPVTPGLPVSWPVPNPVQKTLSHSPMMSTMQPTITAAPVGDPMAAHDISSLQGSFSRLLERCAVDGNRRKWEDTGRKLGELYEKLGAGHISNDSVAKLRQLAEAVDREDYAEASRLRMALSATDWDKNRTWLFALQLLLPK